MNKPISSFPEKSTPVISQASTQTKRKWAWLDIITDGLSYSVALLSIGTFVGFIINAESRATIEYGFAPSTVMMLAGLIIFFIALLEGSQIAIINVADKDLSADAERFPFAYQIQQLTRNETDIGHYLIGRQLLVVALVTVFSLLTSFPNVAQLTPELRIPAMIDLIVFKFGLINAMILLWVGQLIPQLLASKSPQRILNARSMKYMVLLCLGISRLKIAKPSSMVADWIERKRG